MPLICLLYNKKPAGAAGCQQRPSEGQRATILQHLQESTGHHLPINDLVIGSGGWSHSHRFSAAVDMY